MATIERLQLAMALLALLLAQLAIAGELIARHMQMQQPQPFAFNEFGPTNPLNPDGSDYPCKVPQGESYQMTGTPTEMAIGEDQTVSFSGTAVHGGGSCQFALAEGLEPTKDTPWKVIQSIEGGCPKANIEGNLEGGEKPDEYTFKIPDDFTPGDYTFAWTWVNRIGGQPEFLKASGGSRRVVKDRRVAHNQRQSTYPDLFLANIGEASNGCDTSEALTQQVAIQYPNPGGVVVNPEGTDKLFKQSCDGNSRNSGGSSGGSAATATGASASATGSASSPSGNAS
ncbi:hypothetical protein J7T55_002033 [Diaporthe amygdali]|uniref:uncharacterized protein n=1 Tax=Phomopsis amygdali TaxID=1214568 RepID=UPI0022FF2F80|nr:uncharacterized protein J7T55_002033 [Diaporthe amygdali]KAJ0108429.1 hypothetical protein J7T55_002033 [Diaporthe amygdali]